MRDLSCLALTGERSCFHGPAERLGHGFVEIGDEQLDFRTQGAFAGEIAAAKKLSPRMENQISIWLSHDACLGVKWKMTRCYGSCRNASRVALHANAPDFSFDAKLELEARDTGNEADDGLRKVDVEICRIQCPTLWWERRCWAGGGETAFDREEPSRGCRHVG